MATSRPALERTPSLTYGSEEDEAAPRHQYPELTRQAGYRPKRLCDGRRRVAGSAPTDHRRAKEKEQPKGGHGG